MKTAARIAGVEEYYFAAKLREIRSRQDAGEDIINLGIGSPDLSPPDEVLSTLTREIGSHGSFMYKPYLGIPELREAMADFYAAVYNVSLAAENFLPLIGSKEGVGFISLAYLNPGDEVLVPDPGYPTYEAATRLAGAISVRYDLKPDLNWHPDPEKIRMMITSRTRLIWLNYPNMPTGANANMEVLEEIIKIAQQADLLVCHDNPYSMILTDEPFSILSIENALANVIELNSLSKSYNMAGVRMGMLSGAKQLVNPVFKVQSNFSSGMFEPVQHAAVAALRIPRSEWFDSINNTYRERKKIALEMMDLLGCKYDALSSGMFVWASIPSDFNSGEELSELLLDEAHVFITPGHIFGENGAKYVRTSLCTPTLKLSEAKDRIRQFKLGRSKV